MLERQATPVQVVSLCVEGFLSQTMDDLLVIKDMEY